MKASKKWGNAPLVTTDVSRSTQISNRTENQWRVIARVVIQQIIAKLPQTSNPVRREPVKWIAALEIFAMLPQYHWSAPSSSPYALFWPLLFKP